MHSAVTGLHRLRPMRSALTVLSLAALSLGIVSQVLARDYQERRDLTCKGSPTNCRGTFEEVAAGKVLSIQFVSCFVDGIGLNIDTNKAAFLGINNALGNGFRHTLTWEVRETGNRTIMIVSQPVQLRVPAERRPDIQLPFPSLIAVSGDCAISGDLANAP